MVVVVLWWWLTDGGRRRTWGRRRRLFKLWRCGLRECKAAGKSNHRSLGQVPALADFPQHTRSGSSGPRRAPGRQGCGHLQRAAKHGPTPLVRPCFSHQPGDANYHWVKRMSRSSALESGRLGRIFLTGSTASTSARGLRFCPGNGRTPAWIHVHVAERRDPLALCIPGRDLRVEYRPAVKSESPVTAMRHARPPTPLSSITS